MKIIYEDGSDRPQTEGRSGVSPAPPDKAPDAQNPLPNLSPEQISALLQILANQQAQQTAAPAAPQAPAQPEPESPAAPPQDPGTRILYQSADFEPLEKKKTPGKPRRVIPDPGTRIAYQAKDPDELREERERRRAVRQGSFSVNEFSLVDDTPEEAEAYGDLDVNEVDEATEAFRTQRAKRLVSAPPEAPVPQEIPAPQPPVPAPQPEKAAPPADLPPVIAAEEAAPDLPAQTPSAPPAQPPAAPIAAVAVGETADEAALRQSAKAQENRLQEAARRQEERAQKAKEQQELERLARLEAERAEKEQALAAKEALRRQKEADKAAAAAAKAQAKTKKETDKASAAEAKAQAKLDRANGKAAAKAEKAEQKRERKANKTPWSPLRKTVLTVSVLAILASCGVLAWEYKLHKDNLKLEDEVSGLILEAQLPNAPMAGGNTIQLTEEQQWDQIRGEFPGAVFPPGTQLKYARLFATNTDFVGYLEIPGVNMSLPVVQTNNDSDYLNKNFFGAATKYGCPFVSCINNVADLDFNTVIYGHHMNDRTIFGALDAYKSIDGFRAAPVITFNTLYADYSWKIVAVILTNAVPADDNGYVFNYYFNQLSSDEKKTEYYAALKERSLYDTGVDLLPSDKLLTLSTCSHEFDDARLVVVARLVRPGESTDTDTSLATLNTKVHYPQVYYSKKKQTNPYADAPRWEVG